MRLRPEAIRSGPGQQSLWDYPRPPRLEAVAERITVQFAGETIADTTQACRVLETSRPPVYYLPRVDPMGLDAAWWREPGHGPVTATCGGRQHLRKMVSGHGDLTPVGQGTVSVKQIGGLPDKEVELTTGDVGVSVSQVARRYDEGIWMKSFSGSAARPSTCGGP